ncbi:MAG: DUF4124 domain-containing protein [Betaproteobacteria bacterium]|nr:DUF4124 domain-containing protein [Betaproteobacteria bacterium]
MRGLRCSLSLVLALAAGAAHAQASEIWKCVDAQGQVLFTSERRDTAGRKCELLSRQEVNVVPAQKPGVRVPSPSGFPRESTEARAAARQRQRQTLDQELTKEQDALAQAQKSLAEQEAVRYGNERNYQRVLDRLQPYKDAVERHQKNIDALKRELANLDKN